MLVQDALSLEEEPWQCQACCGMRFLKMFFQELPPETLSERVRRVQQQWSLFRAGRFVLAVELHRDQPRWQLSRC